METRYRSAISFIFVTVLLDMLAFGIIAPVLPQLIADFLQGTWRASEYMGYFVTIWALMQLFFSPVLGSPDSPPRACPPPTPTSAT